MVSDGGTPNPGDGDAHPGRAGEDGQRQRNLRQRSSPAGVCVQRALPGLDVLGAERAGEQAPVECSQCIPSWRRGGRAAAGSRGAEDRGPGPDLGADRQSHVRHQRPVQRRQVDHGRPGQRAQLDQAGGGLPGRRAGGWPRHPQSEGCSTWGDGRVHPGRLRPDGRRDGRYGHAGPHDPGHQGVRRDPQHRKGLWRPPGAPGRPRAGCHGGYGHGRRQIAGKGRRQGRHGKRRTGRDGW